MKTIDFANTIAADMDKALNSEENKQLFSSSSMIEKLAFKKVSEEDAITEVEAELDRSLTKTAGCKECVCVSSKKGECKCDCHDDSSHSKEASRNLVLESLNSLLKVSEDLDNAGFEKIAALSIVLADKLVSEAKAKKSDKKSKEKSKSKSESKSKSKMDIKERMKKMRDAKNKGKKSEKKVSKAQATDLTPPQHIEPVHTPHREADIIMAALPPSAKGSRVEVEMNVVTVSPGNLVPLVTKVVQNLQLDNKLPFNKKYRIVAA